MAKGKKHDIDDEEVFIGVEAPTSLAASDEGAGTEAEGINGTAVAEAGPKAVKRRMAYYMVCSVDQYDTPDSVLCVKRSRRAAEKWLWENRMLVAKVAGRYIMVRCVNMVPRDVLSQ